MTAQGSARVTSESVLGFIIAAAIGLSGCTAPDPQLLFIDDESGVSFTHPPRWKVGFAEQSGLRYRYVTAPRLEEDKEALSITLIAPTEGASVDSVAQAYLTGASEVVPSSDGDASIWSFKDSSGVRSRLRLSRAPAPGRFFGAWVRGSDAAFKQYDSRLRAFMASLHAESSALWPEEKFAGMSVRVPSTWARATRLSNATNASMQFKTLPLDVEKGTNTIHGFVTVSKEPVPSPGDLNAFNKFVKDRASDTVSIMEHRAWPPVAEGQTPTGFADYLRSGNAVTATRIRRYITVKNGVGLTLQCEARADVFERFDPWCRRLAETVRLD